jgi:hypothetical protein
MAIYPPFKKIFNWQLWNEKTKTYLPLRGVGAPSVTNVNAQSIGQIYVDTNAGKVYAATGVTGAPLLDWALLN